MHTETAKLTIRLPREDLDFAKAYAKAHGVSLTEVSLRWGDFEDAVVAAAAESSGCELIISRNIKDFSGSPVPVLTPDEYLATLDGNVV